MNGQSIAHGSSFTAYQSTSVPFGSTCKSESRTCTNGSLSGSYAYSDYNASWGPFCSGEPISKTSVIDNFTIKKCGSGYLSSSDWSGLNKGDVVQIVSGHQTFQATVDFDTKVNNVPQVNNLNDVSGTVRLILNYSSTHYSERRISVFLKELPVLKNYAAAPLN